MNSLIDLLRQAARLSGQRLERSRLPAVRDAIERSERTDPLSRFMAVWRAGGLRGLPVRIRTPEPTDLPVLAWTEATGYVLLDGVGADGALAGRDAKGAPATLMPERDMSFLRLATREDVELVPRALPLIRQAVWKHKAAVFESVVATFVVSLLALGTSLYSMQIYDRVIPNQGYQTLWVLTAGALGAILLEWVLKQVRTHIMDRAGLEIDKDLSQWFFERLQGARMDARPATVGTLAAQVKGFETVRAMLTSTSLYILADIPFAIFFVLVIASLGGVLVVVPVIALPLALAAGLGFQRAIWNQARKMTASSYRKNGLLVEAVEAAESVKANRGEWQLARRWHDLVVAVSEADERIRVYSAWSQNITALLQQGGYIALVAAGAWMVTNNHLTMGALLAITIISNRAMTPILQLPGVLVQWAHARSALEGLDQIIALPNEQDGIGERLLPETLAASVRFERVRFSYGMQRTALEIEARARARCSSSPRVCTGHRKAGSSWVTWTPRCCTRR
jgi:ATP-binding cassette subfamily C protein LapB